VAKAAASGRAPSWREGRAAFLAPLSVDRLWPLEEKVLGRLEMLGLHTVGQLQQIPVATLAAHFGGFGKRLREMAFGVDQSPLRALYPPETREARLASAEGMQLAAALEALSAQVAQLLHEQQQTPPSPSTSSRSAGRRCACRCGFRVRWRRHRRCAAPRRD
jgi:nucleotidyltransferase/DNA polymerase involved in DNA repair